jgi:hypothetical protein
MCPMARIQEMINEHFEKKKKRTEKILDLAEKK